MRTPQSSCWECGYKVDAATAAYGDRGRNPNPGDVTVCLNCGAISVFATDFTLRKPEKIEEVEILHAHPELVQMQIVRAGVVTEDLRKRKN